IIDCRTVFTFTTRRPPISTLFPYTTLFRSLSTPATAGMQYPPTRRADAADVLHGVQVPDPYRWLEDEKSPEVQAWMAAQDKFARSEETRLNSSHDQISYAVFCLKKKKKKKK